METRCNLVWFFDNVLWSELVVSLGILKHFPQVRKIIFIEEKYFFSEKNGDGKEGKYFFSWKLKIGEGKGGRYLEVKNVFFVKVKKLEKEDH